MKLQTKLFRLISQPFESSAQRETRILREEKEKAIERFYQTMTKGVTLNTFNAVFAQYKQAGFEILPEHCKYLARRDPFSYLTGQLSAFMIEKIWTEMIPKEYQDWHKETQYIFKTVFWKKRHAFKNVKSLNSDALEEHVLSYIQNEEVAKFLIKNVFKQRKTDNIKECQQMIKAGMKYYGQYRSLHATMNHILEQMMNFTQDSALSYEQTELDSFFKADKRTKEQKTILEQIKQLRLYETQLGKTPELKQTLIEILDYSEQLISNKRFTTLLEEKFELERLLTKHLPEILSDYTDLPDNLRYKALAEQEKNPFELTKETLKTIQTTIEKIGQEVFEKNIKSLSIKNRLMKKK